MAWPVLNCGDHQIAGEDGVKNRPNHRQYLQILRRMSPEQRLQKAFELSDFSKALFVHGLRRRFTDLSPEEFSRVLRSRLERCRNSAC